MNLQAVVQCFSSILNTVLEQGCRITPLIDGESLKIEFGVRGSKTENINYRIPINETRSIDSRQIRCADEFSAIMILACLGFEAEIDRDYNCILISRNGDFYELSLAETYLDEEVSVNVFSEVSRAIDREGGLMLSYPEENDPLEFTYKRGFSTYKLGLVPVNQNAPITYNPNSLTSRVNTAVRKFGFKIGTLRKID